MKQILQSLKTGATEVANVPCPAVRAGQLLIRTEKTLVSAGSERMLVEFGKAGMVSKARQQPEKVRMVLDKIKTDGLLATYESVMSKLDQPLALGYCNFGVVVAVGPGVRGFQVGDRVVSNGKHAEMVSVPVNLCAKAPDGVSGDHACFTVLGAIALQGIRLVQPTLGEMVAVTGLGLIGLVTVQLLRAHGCRVLGLDFDPKKLEMARVFGAETVNLSANEDPVAAAQVFSRGRGVDAVIITAATKSNEPVHQGALMCRKHGRIVLVGVTGLELSRADFFEKELTFQVSCSYGPGRYDANYEEKGNDYPIGYVRWTEQRNFEAVLDMMADGKLDVEPLISHRFEIGNAEKAYELIGSSAPSLGILLDYPLSQRPSEIAIAAQSVQLPAQPASTGDVALAFVGSGAYAVGTLIPAFKATGARLQTVASSGGVSGLHAGRRFGFATTTTDTESIFTQSNVDAVVISTRHDSHASMVCRALAAGKHVFVEKPLGLTLSHIDEIEEAFAKAQARGKSPIVMVGFNRRFAPQVQKIHSLLAGVTGPKAFVMTVNAGAIPADHWVQDQDVGGGRIVGEGCHFIDLIRFLAGAPITKWQRVGMNAVTADTLSMQFEFADGSIGTVHYFANGTKRFPKERLEVFAAGRVLQLDNFRKLRGFGWPGFSRMSLWRQDKGQRGCALAFIRAVQAGGHSPIPFSELLEVARVTVEIEQG